MSISESHCEKNGWTYILFPTKLCLQFRASKPQNNVKVYSLVHHLVETNQFCSNRLQSRKVSLDGTSNFQVVFVRMIEKLTIKSSRIMSLTLAFCLIYPVYDLFETSIWPYLLSELEGSSLFAFYFSWESERKFCLLFNNCSLKEKGISPSHGICFRSTHLG